MMKDFFRAVIAQVIAICLLTGGLTVFAAPRGQSDAQKTSNQTKSDKKSSQKTPATTASNGKVLSEKEDPRLVGKRNINTGIIGGGSVEKEVNLGRQLAADVDRQAKFVDDPVITEYVNRVGQNIVLHSDAKIPFTIKVIDSDEANAFALPGGFFYVNKGLLLAADSEAELAGVMAHEIAHVTARHSVENLRKANIFEGLATIGSIFLGGIPGMIYQGTAGFGLTALFLKFNRGAEEEADRLAAQYLWAAGYDPSAMSTMFEKLLAKNQKKSGFISKVFSSHPQTPDRIEASRVLVSRFPDRDEYILSTSEFQRVKARMLRLSNARASTVGDITDEEGNRRPTLKRRSPAPDDPATTDDGQSPSDKPAEKKDEPPKLKRRTDDQNPPAQKDNP